MLWPPDSIAPPSPMHVPYPRAGQDHLVNAGRLGRGEHVVARRTEIEPGNVLGHVAVEQFDILRQTGATQ